VWLPSETQAFGRLAREATGERIGIALGGGGARGFAHVGVLLALEEAGIPLDIIAGCSMGAVVAAGYATGRSAQQVNDDMRHFWKGQRIFDFTIPYVSLLKGRIVARMALGAYGKSQFEQLPRKLYLIATDLISGREVVLEHGSVDQAVLASGAVPGVFPPVAIDKWLLVDGSVLNRVPVDILRRKGARVTISVDVTAERENFLQSRTARSSGIAGRLLRSSRHLRNLLDQPSIIRTLTRTIFVGSGPRVAENDPLAISLRPAVEEFDFYDFQRYDEIVETGRRCGLEAVDRIKDVLRNSFNLEGTALDS
jgi:NTE family protein